MHVLLMAHTNRALMLIEIRENGKLVKIVASLKLGVYEDEEGNMKIMSSANREQTERGCYSPPSPSYRY